MSNTENDERTHASPDDRHQHGRYEIRVQGHLDPRWSSWFDGLSLTRESDGTTVIQGPVLDQAALHGLLRKVRDLGLALVSVVHVESEQRHVPTVALRKPPLHDEPQQ